jgi:hypothetical protein
VAKSLEEAKVGGLGIRLMRSYASGMHDERRDGRNRLTLRFVKPQGKSIIQYIRPRLSPFSEVMSRPSFDPRSTGI